MLMLVRCLIVCITLLIKLSFILSSVFDANATYGKVRGCIDATWMMYGKKRIDWQYPIDADDHYQDILNRTARFRLAPVHEYAGYSGPWIENHFISAFIGMPLSFFNGLIPIFIQWIDSQILRGRHFDNILSELNSLLRPNVLYITVSQGDVGLGKIAIAHPNILVLSAGGFGHIPIPLIRGEIPWTPLPKYYQQTIGFFGTANQWYSNRPHILAKIKALAHEMNVSYRQGMGKTWQKDMEYSMFNLAPRGYGRNSFRFSEAVQMGRIPVLLYDDHAWVAYRGSNITIEKYGFVGGLREDDDSPDNLGNLVSRLKNLSTNETEYHRRIDMLRTVRLLFTYPGVLHQIELFLKDPFGLNGGALTCAIHPKTERCCDELAPLLKCSNDTVVYMVKRGKKMRFRSADAFLKRGFQFAHVKSLSAEACANLTALPEGAPL